MTLAILDTNAYLRLAKRVRPLLGVKFGQKGYVLTILKDVEEEVYRNPRLRLLFPWFDEQSLQQERLAKTFRLSREEREMFEAASSVLHQWAIEHALQYKNPPSPVDCRVLAFGQIRDAIVVTDDLGMHALARDFEIPVWHGHELLSKMLTARHITKSEITEIFDALDRNDDLPHSWREVKHTSFFKVFGKPQ